MISSERLTAWGLHQATCQDVHNDLDDVAVAFPVVFATEAVENRVKNGVGEDEFEAEVVEGSRDEDASELENGDDLQRKRVPD